jgi:hypothetical protein
MTVSPDNELFYELRVAENARTLFCQVSEPGNDVMACFETMVCQRDACTTVNSGVTV